jgi:hypothetical protein
VTTAWAPRLWGDFTISRQEARELVTSQHKRTSGSVTGAISNRRLTCVAVASAYPVVVQANAYTNSTFCIAAARAGEDDGIHSLISGSLIVDPQGRIVAENVTEEE